MSLSLTATDIHSKTVTRRMYIHSASSLPGNTSLEATVYGISLFLLVLRDVIYLTSGKSWWRLVRYTTSPETQRGNLMAYGPWLKPLHQFTAQNTPSQGQSRPVTQYKAIDTQTCHPAYSVYTLQHSIHTDHDSAHSSVSYPASPFAPDLYSIYSVLTGPYRERGLISAVLHSIHSLYLGHNTHSVFTIFCTLYITHLDP